MKLSDSKHIPNRYISTTLAPIAKLDVSQLSFVNLDLFNEGTGALNAFQIRMRSADSPSHRYILRKSSGYMNSSDLIVLDASADPTSLASGAGAQIQINVECVESLEIWASAVAETTLDVVMGGYNE